MLNLDKESIRSASRVRRGREDSFDLFGRGVIEQTHRKTIHKHIDYSVTKLHTVRYRFRGNVFTSATQSSKVFHVPRASTPRSCPTETKLGRSARCLDRCPRSDHPWSARPTRRIKDPPKSLKTLKKEKRRPFKYDKSRRKMLTVSHGPRGGMAIRPVQRLRGGAGM